MATGAGATRTGIGGQVGMTVNLTASELHDLALEWGMSETEYANFAERAREFSQSYGLPLDLALNVVTIAMCSVEWSEHCGYPRSRAWLKTLPRSGRFSSHAGEDSGGIDIGDNLLVVFKMESHNHPSAVEPYQGAATGIGGIVRDILTVGARPIALLDSLRFGKLDKPRNRYLLNGVVAGIADYGNCIGVPTVGGEVYFADAYEGNCLVNVMCVGVVEADKTVTSRARGVGNAVMYVGASTGRDGIGGCSVLASHEFGENDQKRPTVQIGDPFTKKCLIEAFLEAMKTGAIVSAKDMGAAGVTCTTSESCAAGGSGMDIDLALIPRREEGMQAYEVVMSESQERMLLVVEKGREAEVAAIFHKWGLHAVVIGRVTEDGVLWIREHGELIAAIPATVLTEAPLYNLPAERPSYLDEVRSFRVPVVDPGEALLKLLASPNVASKRYIYRQYDHMVQTNTVVLPGEGDAALLRIKGTKKGIAVTTDCNGRYCYLDPRRGAQIAVAEAARNVVCVGATPAAITDCLNFGNPEKPDRYWQFVEAIQGVSEACRALEVSVVSGNVSFYNESPASAIYPTPTIGLVGVLEDRDRRCTLAFKHQGDVIILLGDDAPASLGGSEYLEVIGGQVAGEPPALDLEQERRLQACCLEAIQDGLLQSAHDCSDGGLAVALAECCIVGKIGAVLEAPAVAPGQAALEWLFHEGQSRIVVSTAPESATALLALAQKAGVKARVLGTVGGDSFLIDGLLEIPIEQLRRAWSGAAVGNGC